MRILLVDDESKKLRDLKKVLTTLDGITNKNIEHSLELLDAKKKLLENYYDFLILDLNMPEVLGEDTNENAGIDFIDEIIGVDSYIKPQQIIVLTAFDGLEEKFKNIQDKLAFPVYKYDDNSTEWANNIKEKVKYSLLCKQNKCFRNETHLCDVAIITAVPVETEAVKRISFNWQKEELEGDPSIYYSTRLNSNNREIRVVTAQQSEMGMCAAATLSTKIINHYKPKYLIMVGIAAGINSNLKFGDIVVASETWNYMNGKYCEKGEEGIYDFLPDPKSIQLNTKIKEIVGQDFKEVLYKIKCEWIQPTEYDLNMVCAPIACGTAVVANRQIVKEHIQIHSRKTVALDMESYGVFYAANNNNDLNTIAICIKSISDFADGEKGDSYQRYASYTSVKFMQYLVENQLKF